MQISDCYDLPRTQRLSFYDEPECEERPLEFRLIYRGSLPAGASRSRVKEKHDIRKVFHRQLAELWDKQPDLHYQKTMPLALSDRPPLTTTVLAPQVNYSPDASGKPWVEHLAEQYERCKFRFVPLVRKNGVSCALDILFLRRDDPGKVVSGGGDIDNRIKVLFDALKIVGNCEELGGATPDADENPFFCLLEDDSLITELSVTTDRLLTPQESAERLNDVHLVIRVRLTNPSLLFVNGRLI